MKCLKYLFLVLLSGWAGICPAWPQVLATTFFDREMRPLIKRNTPVYFAECSWRQPPNEGKIFIIMTQGSVKGKYVDFAWSDRIPRAKAQLGNEGNFTSKPHLMLMTMSWGGPSMANEFLNTVRQLLASNPVLLEPKDFASIMTSQPKTKCPIE